MTSLGSFLAQAASLFWLPAGKSLFGDQELFHGQCPFFSLTLSFMYTDKVKWRIQTITQIIKPKLPLQEPCVTRRLDFDHKIKARAHKGDMRIGKTPKKLASICCP
jgi:hypothetical protein